MCSDTTVFEESVCINHTHTFWFDWKTT